MKITIVSCILCYNEKKTEHFIKNYLWLLPFFSFLCGYFLLSYYTHVQSLTVPSLVGKNIHEAITLLSQLKLNPRLLAQKEEPALPEGTILRQVPTSGQKIKPHQPIFLVTTKKQPPIATPNVFNKSIDTIAKELANTEIRFKIYYVPNNFPQQHCFSQSQPPGDPLENNHLLILYLSAGNNKAIIWPDFTQRPLEEAIEFLASYHIKPHIIANAAHKNSQPTDKIIEQQPLAGSLIILQKTNPLFVQFRTQCLHI